jgi:hypothetical protein
MCYSCQAFPAQSYVCGQGQERILEWSTVKVASLGKVSLTRKNFARLERPVRNKHKLILPIP